MTDKAVTISIHIKAGKAERILEKQIAVCELEQGLENLGQKMTVEVSQTILEVLDDEIQHKVPESWQNVGRERRSLVMAQGWISYSRRVYKDEQGKRIKPLDMLLDIQPYERSSLKVQTMGSVLAAQTTYRMAADSLSYLVKTDISASSVQRMVWKIGQRIQVQEETYEAEEAGKISAPILFGESDGVWVHLQREKVRKKEVKVAVMYTGKQAIGKDRYKLVNKLALTQLGGTTLAWQEKLRNLADRTYDLDKTRLMAVGGDGNAWVRQSFDLFNLPQAHLLDRFHVSRALKQSFGQELDTSKLCESLYTQGFESIAAELLNCIRKSRGKRKEQRQKTYQYLENNQDALIDLDKRGYLDLFFPNWMHFLCSLGTIEGNVDKLVVHRMKGRGCSWRLEGAGSMLAILRHLDDLKIHCFKFFPIAQETNKSTTKPRIKHHQSVYQPASGSISFLQGGYQSKPWVQLLKQKLNYGLSLNAYF
jgi:hypothetical protein